MSLPTRCALPGCSDLALVRVVGVPACLSHMGSLEETAHREASLDHPPTFPVFRFVRRRRGYEVWLHYGRGAQNLTAIGNLQPVPLKEAQQWAQDYARDAAFPYIDQDRVLSKETLRELLQGEAR